MCLQRLLAQLGALCLGCIGSDFCFPASAKKHSMCRGTVLWLGGLAGAAHGGPNPSQCLGPELQPPRPQHLEQTMLQEMAVDEVEVTPA